MYTLVISSCYYFVTQAVVVAVVCTLGSLELYQIYISCVIDCGPLCTEVPESCLFLWHEMLKGLVDECGQVMLNFVVYVKSALYDESKGGYESFKSNSPLNGESQPFPWLYLSIWIYLDIYLSPLTIYSKTF